MAEPRIELTPGLLVNISFSKFRMILFMMLIQWLKVSINVIKEKTSRELIFGDTKDNRFVFLG